MFQVVYAVYDEREYKNYGEPVNTKEKAEEISTELYDKAVIEEQAISLVWTGFIELLKLN